jgi:hypothetical protein
LYTAPFDILAAVFALFLTFWLLSFVDYKKEGLAVFIVALIGLFIYFAYRLPGKKTLNELAWIIFCAAG